MAPCFGEGICSGIVTLATSCSQSAFDWSLWEYQPLKIDASDFLVGVGVVATGVGLVVAPHVVGLALAIGAGAAAASR